MSTQLEVLQSFAKAIKATKDRRLKRHLEKVRLKLINGKLTATDALLCWFDCVLGVKVQRPSSVGSNQGVKAPQ